MGLGFRVRALSFALSLPMGQWERECARESERETTKKERLMMGVGSHNCWIPCEIRQGEEDKKNSKRSHRVLKNSRVDYDSGHLH